MARLIELVPDSLSDPETGEFSGYGRGRRGLAVCTGILLGLLVAAGLLVWGLVWLCTQV